MCGLPVVISQDSDPISFLGAGLINNFQSHNCEYHTMSPEYDVLSDFFGKALVFVGFAHSYETMNAIASFAESVVVYRDKDPLDLPNDIEVKSSDRGLLHTLWSELSPTKDVPPLIAVLEPGFEDSEDAEKLLLAISLEPYTLASAAKLLHLKTNSIKGMIKNGALLSKKLQADIDDYAAESLVKCDFFGRPADTLCIYRKYSDLVAKRLSVLNSPGAASLLVTYQDIGKWRHYRLYNYPWSDIDISSMFLTKVGGFHNGRYISFKRRLQNNLQEII